MCQALQCTHGDPPCFSAWSIICFYALDVLTRLRVCPRHQCHVAPSLVYARRGIEEDLQRSYSYHLALLSVSKKMTVILIGKALGEGTDQKLKSHW